ncbi:MAG: TonB family protein [Alphaproteobacteria bacterium]|nr:TonB family protein [Alphaproteobacteria bacterium]
MPPGLEPAFAPGRHHWPLAGLGTGGFEPDVPDLTVPAGVLERGARDFPDRLFVARISGDIVSSPAEPMGPPPVVVRGWSAKWRLALAASCLLHAAAALSFLNLQSEAVLIEGAELSGIAFHGNASEDQMSAGELSRTSEPAVEVTMITMMEARPVDTTEAEMSPADEIAEAVGIVEMEGPVVERVQPERVAVARPVASSDAVPAETVTAQAASAMPPEPAEPVETIVQPSAPGAEPALEILATDRSEWVADDPALNKAIEPRPAEPVEVVERDVQVAAETADAPSAESVESTEPAQPDSKPEATVSETTEAPISSPVGPDRIQPVEVEFAEASEILAAVASPPLPEPRPEIVELTEQEPARRPREVESGKKAESKPAAKAKKAGNGGSNQTDSRRGQADGRETGQAASSSKGGKSSAAGNAALSNYPGKVANKLRRALRYPAAAKRQRLRGQVRVSFVVSAGGGVSGIRVVASSGSSILDSAAIEAVRRAAPFPAIPVGAGRSSWPFTVPLAFSR